MLKCLFRNIITFKIIVINYGIKIINCEETQSNVW